MSAVLGVHFFLGDDWRGFDDPFAELVVIPQQQLLPACGFPPNGGIFMRFAVIEGGPGPQGGGPVEGVCLSLADFVEDLEMAQVALVRQPLVVFLHLEIMHALTNTHPLRKIGFNLEGMSEKGKKWFWHEYCVIFGLF